MTTTMATAATERSTQTGDAGLVAELEALRERYIPQSYLQHHPFYAATGEGAWITDVEGNRYIDFAGGIGVMNLGHRHPRVVQALHEQVDRLLHTGPVTLHEGYVRLAARLAEKVPGSSPKQALFVNSGAEAVENAIKLARYATGRTAIVAFDRSFHGRTLMTSAMTGKTHPYKMQPGSLAPDIFHSPYPYPYRPPAGVPAKDLVSYCLGALDDLLVTRVAAEKVAAVIVEPVQGEGGYIVPPPGFLRGVQEWSRRIGALFIVDEIQSGFGRTGRLFAMEHEGLVPDIVVLGKSLAAGLPLGAVVAATDVYDRAFRGDIGGTYGGNPLACAAGLATLDVFESEPVLERAVTVADTTHRRLEAMASRHASIGEVRGLGAMQAIELVKDRTTKEPATELTDRVIAEARARGLMLIKTGVFNNAIRLLVPLTIDDTTLDDGLQRLEAALEAADE